MEKTFGQTKKNLLALTTKGIFLLTCKSNVGPGFPSFDYTGWDISDEEHYCFNVNVIGA